MENKPINIYQRLNEAKKKIAYIQKDKKVESYMAVTHDAVTAATRQILIDCGIMVIPSEEKNSVVVAGATSKGTPIIRYEASFYVRFVNVEEPADFVGMTVTAHAMDHGDKAPGKALSYATKYAILKALQLETGEDDESRAPASGGVSDDFLAQSKIEIDAADSEAVLKGVWAAIVSRCKAEKDMEAYNHLKACVAARANQLKDPK